MGYYAIAWDTHDPIYIFMWHILTCFLVFFKYSVWSVGTQMYMHDYYNKKLITRSEYPNLTWRDVYRLICLLTYADRQISMALNQSY